MRFLKDKKIFIAIAVSVAAVLFLVWLDFFFESKKIRESAEAYQKEKLNYHILQGKKEELAKLKNELSGLEYRGKELEAMFIKKDEAVPFLKLLERTAEDSSCQIKIEPMDLAKVKFEEVRKAEKVPAEDEQDAKKPAKSQEKNKEIKKQDDLTSLKSYPAFNISVVGEFLSVADFLQRMENLPFFIRPLIIDAAAAEKEGAKTGSGSGTIAAAGQNDPASQSGAVKNVKMTFIIVVYGE